jgi:hypothetical protein
MPSDLPLGMRKIARVVVAALLLQFFVGGVSTNAATTPLKLSSVSVSGTFATIKWSATALTSKDFFEIEFTKTATNKTYKVIKTKSNAIVASLEPFTSYTVRLRKTLTPKVWTPSRTFTVTSSPVSGIAISGNTYTSVDVSWPAVIGASS